MKNSFGTWKCWVHFTSEIQITGLVMYRVSRLSGHKRGHETIETGQISQITQTHKPFHHSHRPSQPATKWTRIARILFTMEITFFLSLKYIFPLSGVWSRISKVNVNWSRPGNVALLRVKLLFSIVCSNKILMCSSCLRQLPRAEFDHFKPEN